MGSRSTLNLGKDNISAMHLLPTVRSSDIESDPSDLSPIRRAPLVRTGSFVDRFTALLWKAVDNGDAPLGILGAPVQRKT